MMINLKKILIGGLFVVLSSGSLTYAETLEPGSWLLSPHVGGSPASFNTPFGLTTIVTDNPQLPAPIVVIPNVQTPPPPPPSDNDDNLPAATTVNVAKANYNKMYRTPFIFGLDIGFIAAPNLEVFFGYQYLRARGKKFFLSSQVLNNVQYVFHAELKSYDAHIGHVGVRRYFDIHPCFSPFIGVKLGGSQNKQGITHLTLQNGVQIAGQSTFDTPGYFNTIGFIGGPQIGFDYRLTEGTRLFVSGEALYKTSHYADTRPGRFGNNNPGAVKLQSQVTQFGTNLWAFPFTFGIRIIR